MSKVKLFQKLVCLIVLIDDVSNEKNEYINDYESNLKKMGNYDFSRKMSESDDERNIEQPPSLLEVEFSGSKKKLFQMVKETGTVFS